MIWNAIQPTGCPRLLSLQLLGKGIEGSTLHVEKKYWGGEEGSSVYRWFLVSQSLWRSRELFVIMSVGCWWKLASLCCYLSLIDRKNIFVTVLLVFVDYLKFTGNVDCRYSVCCLVSISVPDRSHVCRLIKMEHKAKSMMQQLHLILYQRGILASRFLFLVSLSGVTGPVVPLFFLSILDPSYLVSTWCLNVNFIDC